MPTAPPYADPGPSRDEIDQLPGPVLLEFGASWCPICKALEPETARLLEAFPGVQWIRVEDGRGKPLGRSFRVKLWPNLVFLRDGQVDRQIARPEPDEVLAALEALTATGGLG